MNTEKRPYAATANVLGVLERVRTRNLPELIDDDLLRVSGVPDVVFGRVMHALRFLGLADEEGRPTERLRRMASAPDAEYRQALADALREAYKEDFARVDPAKDGQAVIVDAFQRYEPRSQTSRMVMLFLGLCRSAGIPVLEAPRERKMQTGPRSERKAGRATGAMVSSGRAARGGAQTEKASGAVSVFTVTEEDIAALDDEEFEEVWNVLGRVARARARTRFALNKADGSEMSQPDVSSEEGLGE